MIPYTLREATAGDIPALVTIENTCFSDPWSEGAIRETLESPHACLLCACTEEDIPVGYVGAYLIAGEADITNVAVLPAYRRLGIGRAMLQAMLAYCRTREIEAIHLEVRVSNTAAIALYEAEGFVRVGLRKSYYKHPTEDACLMTGRI